MFLSHALIITIILKACFAGGMLALGGAHATNGKGAEYMEAGKEVTRTCHESYHGTGKPLKVSGGDSFMYPVLCVCVASKLGAEAFEFDGSQPVTRTNERMYLLRPETVESFFVMWRLTHNEMYRDWGWEVVQVSILWRWGRGDGNIVNHYGVGFQLDKIINSSPNSLINTVTSSPGSIITSMTSSPGSLIIMTSSPAL